MWCSTASRHPDLLAMVVEGDRLVGLLTAENVGEVVALGRARQHEATARA